MQIIRKLIFYSCLIGFCLPGWAQSQVYKLTELPLNDLSAFASPSKNWKIVGDVAGAYTDALPSTKKGSGILYNDYKTSIQYKEDVNIFSKLEHGDIFLSVDFLMPKGSNSGIYFQSRYEIQLFDSWLVKTPRTTDCGSIYERWDDAKPEGTKGYEGHPARSNASFAPNIWQHLEVEFQAPRFDANGKKIKSARFVKVKLNGVVIHENVIVTGPTRAAAYNDEKAIDKLMIQGDHGVVAFRNFKYAILDDFKVDVSDLRYTYYEGKFNDFKELTNGNITRTGKAEAIDVKLADNPNATGLVFNGTFKVKESTDYQFIVKKLGMAQLKIDGEVLVKPGDFFQDDVVTKTLTEGEHSFELSYIKNFSWAPSGIGLLIGKQNARPMALHASSSLPTVTPAPLISVVAKETPEVIRSFMEHNGKKKTQVISIGNPMKVNYSYDLNQGTLLQVWRGDFLNVTDMWHERGEPQTASALGAALTLAGTPSLTIGESNNFFLLDTLNHVTDFRYKGYHLDDAGNPEFSYQYKNLSVKDSFHPMENGSGLKRQLSIDKVEPQQQVLVRLATGKSIEKIGDNIFSIDQKYFISLPAGKFKPEIKASGNKTELIIPCTASTALQYTIVW